LIRQPEIRSRNQQYRKPVMRAGNKRLQLASGNTLQEWAQNGSKYIPVIGTSY